MLLLQEMPEGGKYGWIAAVAMAAGAGALKLIDRFVETRGRESKETTDIKKELREEIAELRKRLSDRDNALDQWKEKYYTVLQTNVLLKGENEDLKNEIEDLKSEVARLEGPR